MIFRNQILAAIYSSDPEEHPRTLADSILSLIREQLESLPLPEYPSYVPKEYAEGHNAGAQAMKEAVLRELEK